MAKRTQQTAAPLIPQEPTIPQLREVSATCRACDLWKRGTQTVFGEGGPKPRVMLVGEQPGTRKTFRDTRSSGRQAEFSIKPWKKPASIGKKSTSPMPSNILNGNREESGAFTRNPTRWKSRRASHGLKPKLKRSGPTSSFVWARQQLRRY